jgi:hypothetical protein
MPLIPNPRMPRPDRLQPQDAAALLAEIQEVLWKQARVNPDDRRDYLDYWNPHKEWDADDVEEIARLLTEAGLCPPEDMPFQVWSEDVSTPAPSGERGYLLGLPIEDAVTCDEEAAPASEPSDVTFEDLERRWTIR